MDASLGPQVGRDAAGTQGKMAETLFSFLIFFFLVNSEFLSRILARYISLLCQPVSFLGVLMGFPSVASLSLIYIFL